MYGPTRRTNARTSPAASAGAGASTDWTELTDTHLSGSVVDDGSILDAMDPLTYDTMNGYWEAKTSATGAIRDGAGEWAYIDATLTDVFADFDWDTDLIEMKLELVSQTPTAGSLYGPAIAVWRTTTNLGWGIGVQDHSAGADRVYKILSPTVGSLVAGTSAKVQEFFTSMQIPTAGTQAYPSALLADKEGGTWVKRSPGEGGAMGATVDGNLKIRAGFMTTTATSPGAGEFYRFRYYARAITRGAL